MVFKQGNEASLQIPDWCFTDVPVVIEEFGIPGSNINTKQKTVINETVSSGNTTLIADYIGKAFDKYDQKWLVQVDELATVQSTGKKICSGDITCNRRYIFIHLGHNQVQQCERNVVRTLFTGLVDLIRKYNKSAKIFVAALLPRPLDMDTSKQSIVKFNRSLAETRNKYAKADPRVQFLPVQHEFIKNGTPDLKFFLDDLLKLNNQGAAVLKRVMFKLAGFIVNK